VVEDGGRPVKTPKNSKILKKHKGVSLVLRTVDNTKGASRIGLSTSCVCVRALLPSQQPGPGIHRKNFSPENRKSPFPHPKKNWTKETPYLFSAEENPGICLAQKSGDGMLAYDEASGTFVRLVSSNQPRQPAPTYPRSTKVP